MRQRVRRETWNMLPLHLNAFLHAKSMVGVTESYENGKWTNWGPEVQEFLYAAGLTKPAPWCAAFVFWSAKQASEDLKLPITLDDVKIPAYVQSYADWANTTDRWITAEEAGPGDLFVLYYPKLERYAHIGFTEEVNEQEKYYLTIEGNTNAAAVREGYKVDQRRRNLTDHTRFIRWA